MTTHDQHQSTKAESQSSEITIDWVNTIKQWKASGLSQVAYCRANNINYNQFVYQNARLSARTRSNSKLLPVTITQNEPAPAAQNNFVLHYPSGLRLQIPINAHPEAIKSLINCLEKRPC